MTSPSTPTRLPIDPNHVALQFARRGDLSDAQFLYAEIARRMDQRLKLIRLQPAEILDAGCGGGQQLGLLHTRYPGAHYYGLDHCPALLDHAQRRAQELWPRRMPGWLLKLLGRTPSARWIQADLANTNLAPESLDLVWSNLSLHWHPAPPRRAPGMGQSITPERLGVFLLLRACDIKRATLRTARRAVTHTHTGLCRYA